MALTDGQKVIRKTRRKIDASFTTKTARAGATKAQLRNHLQQRFPDLWVGTACGLKGVNLWEASADDLFDILYGITWAMRSGNPMDDYFKGQWGVDLGAEQAPQQLQLTA